MSSSPVVSFCIPVHNAEKYIEATLLSIFNQDYRNFEIIVTNDHSTDHSDEILHRFSEVITILQAEKRGAAAARNQAYLKSKGDFIVFFDADDLISPGYLTTQLEKLGDNTKSVVVSNWGRFYDSIKNFKKDSSTIHQDLSFKEWIVDYWTCNKHMTPPGRVLIPRSILAQSRLWDEELSLNDDFDFYSRVFGACNSILFNDRALFYYRSGVGGLSSKVHSYQYQASNFRSIGKAVSIALEKFGNDENVRRACANIWQLFIYENYPLNKDLVKKASACIHELGGADFDFPAGGWSRRISQLIGWKLLKRIKSI